MFLLAKRITHVRATGDLGMAVGDEVVLLAVIDENWFRAEKSGSVGAVPAACKEVSALFRVVSTFCSFYTVSCQHFSCCQHILFLSCLAMSAVLAFL